MPRYGIAINSANCMACYNCFIACRDEHCGFATEVSAPQPHQGHHWLRGSRPGTRRRHPENQDEFGRLSCAPTAGNPRA